MQFNGAEINGAAINGSGAYALTVDAGAYAVTGNDATLYIGYILTADAGYVAVAGQNARLVFDFELVADQGSFESSFSDADFYTGYQLQADSASFLIGCVPMTLDVGVLQLADGRMLNVQTENRAIVLQKESRVISAGGPDSAIMMAAERRTINVLKEQT